MKSSVLLACAAAVLVSGCGSGGTTETAVTEPESSASTGDSTVAAQPAADPCDGVAGCTEIAEVDVDGDGSLDRVGLAITQQALRVTIATSDTVRPVDIPNTGMNSLPDPYVGAYRISRQSGADLVFHTQRGGGNSEQFVVVGWLDGAPVLVPPTPDVDSNRIEPNVWYIAASHGRHEWVTCAQGAEVALNVLSASEAEGMPLPGGGFRQVDHFVYVDGQWSPNGSENIPDESFTYDYDPHTESFRCEDQAR